MFQGMAEMSERVTGVVEDLTRAGWRLSIMPALALPQSLRGPLFEGLRRWADEVSGVLPGPLARTADGLAADLDDLEGRVARREDLGSRLRRERRRAGREAGR